MSGHSAETESSATWVRFPLHRPELLGALQRGEAVLTRAMAPNARTFKPGEKIIGEGEPHGFVYWLRTGWVARTRRLPDERNQIIAIFLPGDFFGVKTSFSTTAKCWISRNRTPMSGSGFGGRSVKTSAGCIVG